MNSDDEFGGGDFLADFNVDQAVGNAQPSVPVASKDVIRQQPEPKRRRVSLTPDKHGDIFTAANSKAELEKTLKKYFGYDSYRPGQLDVIQAVLGGRDAAVFWATGSGKSITYQIPALHSQKTVLVVSPLISLMQDQVQALNFLSDEPVATYLGSAQMDPSQERKALNGEFRLVYVTPEKLTSSGFLSSIARLQIALIAIDEAHCVSEWGHDFRPDFRNVGSSLRNHATLSKIPILALTATAVPRVQDDILTSLQLRNTVRAQASFDRPNLEIIVKPKKGGVASVFADAVNQAKQVSQKLSSTIIYAPTRGQVDEIGGYLGGQLPGQVVTYHAGQSPESRAASHQAFLTSKAPWIVATVAFGMGIDKTDTRSVIHYGAPQTLEAYYQQIGRAGRDGLPSTCILYTNMSDLDRYQSDFYLGNLGAQAKTSTLESMKAMKSFCMDGEKCRRKQLLTYFAEDPAPFGHSCGTCDVCKKADMFGEDTTRDYAAEARLLLTAVVGLTPQGLTNLLKVVAGNVVEDYRYAPGMSPTVLQSKLRVLQQGLETKRSQQFFKELIPIMAQKGFLSEVTKTGQANGYDRTWTVFDATAKARRALGQNGSIFLPVPDTIREQDHANEGRREKVMAQLEANGINTDKLPQKEIEKGDGEVIRAYSKWYSTLENLRKTNRDSRAVQMETLLASIETWRVETAITYQTSPAAVLAEHTAVSIAYTTASLRPGAKLDKESLLEVGVRSRGADDLVARLSAWVDECQPAVLGEASSEERKMALSVVSPQKPWQFAVYKPVKKTGLASWESSYNRYVKGESPQTIAMSPASGKPIQVNTVVGHVLEGLIQGRPVDLHKLAKFSPPPTEQEWAKLKDGCEVRMDVVSDPATSGPLGDKFTLTEFLRPVMGDKFVETPYNERSEEDKAKFNHWCSLVKWYSALRRVGHEPSFD